MAEGAVFVEGSKENAKQKQSVDTSEN